MKNFALLAACFALAACICTGTPLTLTLSDGSTTVTVVDGGAGDVNPVSGAVTWIGSLGTWVVNVTTGIGYPLAGSLSWPYLDLNSVNFSTGPGTLTMTLTQGGFDFPAPPAFLLNIGGTLAGNGVGALTAAACADYGISTCNDAVLGPFTSGAFSGTTWFAKQLEDNYAVGIQVVLTHKAAGTSSFDAELTGVPEPGTYALIGAGLLGLGLLRRRVS